MKQTEVGTCTWLVDELVANRIVERERLLPYLEEFTAESPYADAAAFGMHLARERLITRYQAKRAADGDANKLLVGAYLLVDVVGNGSFGPVHRALGRGDRKEYAVRILPQRSWNVSLVRKQIRAFEKLPPNERLVPFVDVGSAQGSHYLAWPFVEGRSLENIVRECGPLSSDEVARVGLQIAEILKLCHARGIVHGLIKPSNVLVAADGQARLLDFGLGALLAENAEDESLVDTVARAESLARILECAAPESVADSSKWTPSGDQYSLGCTLYFALTGRYPFPGGTFVDKIVNHQRNKPPAIASLNPDVSPIIALVVEQLMRKIPSERFRKIDDLILELVPLATVSRLNHPIPVNVETPLPKAKLSLDSPMAPIEPPLIELPPLAAKRGFFGKMFGGGDAAAETLHATILAAGAARPGETVVLHVYLHGPADSSRLSDAARNHPAMPRVLGHASSKRTIAVGEACGLHLGMDRAAVVDPLREIKRESGLCVNRFELTLPPDLRKKSLTGRLMIGQSGVLIAQLDFVLPVAQ